MKFEPGPGKFILVLSAGLDGAALVILERSVHRDTVPKKIDPYRFTYPDDENAADQWVDSFAIRRVETFSRDRPLGEIVDRMKVVLSEPALRGETDVVIETTAHGQTARQLFYDLPDTYSTSISVTSELTRSPGQTPLADLRGALARLREKERISVAEKLEQRGAVLLAITEGSVSEQPSRLALAIAIGAWKGNGWRTGGPWPGRKPPPYNSVEERVLDGWAMERALMREAREHADQMRGDDDETWWRR